MRIQSLRSQGGEIQALLSVLSFVELAGTRRFISEVTKVESPANVCALHERVGAILAKSEAGSPTSLPLDCGEHATAGGPTLLTTSFGVEACRRSAATHLLLSAHWPPAAAKRRGPL
jgi:hypothetical protein